MIAIIDYNIGNLAAIANMLRRQGATCEITADPATVARAERLILPGNGAFDACMAGLHATGLVPLLSERVLEQKTPLLGICVGAQMLGRGSEEGRAQGLGWLDFEVRRFPGVAGLRVPHMGWCTVTRTPQASPLLGSIDPKARFYFVHSYVMAPDHSDQMLLEAHYGIDFAAAVGSDNILGVQFHPEKSHRFGKDLFRQFLGAGS